MPSSNYAVRLTDSYESLRQVVSAWSLKADKLVCYEHPEPNNVHVHMLLVGVRETPDNLKKILWKTHSHVKGAGKLSIKTTFKSPEGVVTEIDVESMVKYITYMSKGKYEPGFVTGYDSAFIQDCKSKWVNHNRRNRDQTWYDAFVKRIKDHEREEGVRIADIAQIKPFAVTYAFEKYGIISLACRRDMSMLITTYYYEYGNRHADAMKAIQLPYL